VDESTGSYQVSVSGSDWFQNGSVAVHEGGIWYSSANGSMALTHVFDSNGTDALLGSFEALTLNFTTGSSLSIAATFRCYEAGVLVFELAFPEGAVAVNTESPGDQPSGGGEFNASSAPSCHFPSFASTPVQQPDIGFIEWNGRFTNDDDAIGVGLRSFIGGATGGPLVLFGVNSSAPAPAPVSTAAVLGAFDNFKSTMLALAQEPSAPPPSPTCSGVTHGVDQVCVCVGGGGGGGGVQSAACIRGLPLYTAGGRLGLHPRRAGSGRPGCVLRRLRRQPLLRDVGV